jgi:murein DD-endopeptidase MepM/ murein hydrolase activator NlpD
VKPTSRLALTVAAGAVIAGAWILPSALRSSSADGEREAATALDDSPTEPTSAAAEPEPEPAAADRPEFARIEVTIGAHLSQAFASGTRIAEHLEELDQALLGRLDLYAHARPGSALTLWEDRDQRLVAAAVPVGEGPRLLVARYDGDDAPEGWYDSGGQSLEGPLGARPVPLAIVTSGFGARLHPITGRMSRHLGVDYGAPEGTPVRAVAAGRVRRLMIQDGMGIAFEIAHRGGYVSRYFHLRGWAPGLGQGSRVRTGQKIGYVGETGRTTGPHLHYELRKGGQPLDATALLPSTGSTLTDDALAAHGALLRELTTLPGPK